jgi:hypothetical protein
MDLATMERQAALLEQPSSLIGDVLELAEEQEKNWNDLLGRIVGPKAGFGPFWQMLDGAIAVVDQTAVTGTSEVAMWPIAQYTGFAANQLRSAQQWLLLAFGTISTASSSQGNITLTPRFGTTSSGTALGASAATALAASSGTVPWFMAYFLSLRDVGAAGANSHCIGAGFFATTVAAITAATGNVVVFGSTAGVAVDFSVASGLYMGVTMGSASDSLTTRLVTLTSLN